MLRSKLRRNAKIEGKNVCSFSYTLSSFLSPPVFYDDERIASVKKIL